MADDASVPQDDRVRTVPLPTNVGDGADRVIAQNQSSEEALEGGGSPSLDTPPSDAAPGGPPPRIASRGHPTGAAGDEAEDDEGAFPNMREVLDADPVAGGSQSVARDRADDDGDAGTGGEQENDRPRWGGSRL